MKLRKEYDGKKRMKPGDDFKSTFQKRKDRQKDRHVSRKNAVVKSAEKRLKKFRQSSVLAVAVTGFILILFSGGNSPSMEEQVLNGQNDTVEVSAAAAQTQRGTETEKAADEAIGTLQNMWNSFKFNYPKILIAIACLFLAWLLVRFIKLILRRSFKKLKSIEGITTLVTIAIWALAIGIVFSVVAGDIRALIGSFGLIGLVLSWALQTPIESFTGWLLNTFRGYYKVGDRIRVGEVFGDVYRIDFLSTTVWEIGSPYQSGFVSAEQPTGRLVTFPNNEILSGIVVNLTGDFPFVWDELTIAVANESDIPFAMELVDQTSTDAIGNYMREPVRRYSAILHKARLDDEIAEKPPAPARIFRVVNKQK